MIRAQLGQQAGGLARSLAAKAATLAQAEAEARLRRDGWRWREARLLWPQFAKASTRGG